MAEMLHRQSIKGPELDILQPNYDLLRDQVPPTPPQSVQKPLFPFKLQGKVDRGIDADFKPPKDFLTLENPSMSDRERKWINIPPPNDCHVELPPPCPHIIPTSPRSKRQRATMHSPGGGEALLDWLEDILLP